MPPLASLTALEAYLHKIRTIRATGGATPETTYYPALDGLLNAAGDRLRPRVHAAGPLANIGFGLPDGGLYTSHQLQEGTPLPGVKPARGVVEVKTLSVPIGRLLDPSTPEGAQVERYRQGYRGVLVTNLREFVYIGTTAREVDAERRGQPDERERFSLARSEDAFWALVADPAGVDPEVAFQFDEFLARALQFNVPITEPKDLAAYLASYAREARLHLERADLSRLAPLRESIENALDVTFEGERGERFFRATVVQSLFYGLFSAWTLWMRDPDVRPAEMDFSWSTAGFHLRVPMIQALFSEVTKPGTVQALDLRPQIARAAATLNRVQHDELFSKFEDREAIGYFYEWFLEAYDPALREEYGVWYTPPGLVAYMVERVDTVLREELGRPLGLADPAVYVLDPACGTGGYVTAVLDRIRRTLVEAGSDLVGEQLVEAVTTRIYGFEMLTAPFVVAHLMIGLYLREHGAALPDDRRANVILSNALTGWSDAVRPKLPIAEFSDERDAAEHVKRHVPLLVVLGNPPYEGHPGIAVAEERDLTEAYRTTVHAPAPEGRGLNDLYVRFMRMAERAISGHEPGYGLVCYVSNYTWLDGLSHTGMRERYLQAYSTVWIDNLHGDKYRTGKRTPDGQPDPSVFSLGGNKEGIQVGTAVALFARRPDEDESAEAEVWYRDLWGRDKLDRLVATADLPSRVLGYDRLAPRAQMGFPFTPTTVGEGYLDWPALPDLFAFSTPGVFTARDQVVVDVNRDALAERMGDYFDRSASDAEVARRVPAAMHTTKRFDGAATRRALLAVGYDLSKVVPYLYRPFDRRWLYWETETALVDRPRLPYVSHAFAGNVWMAVARKQRQGFTPPVVSEAPASLHVVESGTTMVPLWLKPAAGLFGEDAETGRAGELSSPVPNLSAQSRDYLAGMGLSDPAALFYHALAVLHAPAYQAEHAGALRQDWPRIPLPDDPTVLLNSARLGRRLAALLNVDAEGAAAFIGAELRSIARLRHRGGAEVSRASGHLAVTATWGRAGREGVVMPGPGQTRRRAFRAEEQAVLGEAAAALGPDTVDVYLNDDVFWENVPARVWEYAVGGYQVLKKWLSYREQTVIGRDLTLAEVHHVQQTARRIAAVLLLEAELDGSYAAAVDEALVPTAGPEGRLKT